MYAYYVAAGAILLGSLILVEAVLHFSCMLIPLGLMFIALGRGAMSLVESEEEGEAIYERDRKFFRR